MAASGSAVLAGTVIDLGAQDAAASGISGVAITVKTASGRDVASGLTDAQGRYTIKIERVARPLVLYFDKLGYQSRPTVLKVTEATAADGTVRMVRESAPVAYYRIVAQRTAEPALSPAERQQRVALVVDLPPADKSRVVDEVQKLAAAPVLQEMQVAEHSKAIASNVRSRLADTGYSELAVNADANSGVVQLSGTVETTEQKARATDLAQSVRGVSRVLNELSVRALGSVKEYGFAGRIDKSATGTFAGKQARDAKEAR
jgi:hypothetical protein